MNKVAILFHDPNLGISVEEALEAVNISYSIEKTPVELFEIDPFYCKTHILAEISIEHLDQLRVANRLIIAGTYIVSSNGRYEVVLKEVI
ncbi:MULTISPECIES: hypothetical protein [unclassified Paenibacillus]|uniref:Uncharacterized protein n=1 Tax=Paenibacillus provencensis TaxID=441151 RepID=A0ABW3Q731_9BACL|nr:MULTISPECIES: hypothetical protein [unclassified Paenibacillus]MCM3130183.1 hypothetical protein [Paenibacillus sp. MER 78]SDX71241.1 hypothetical protein SAMN05518848_11275 [Paenibacillus sp. PDC88]SFS88603.1 hypothetical protein SAMN04488601_10671 [Paenibacillus sp. 453mf]